MCSPHPTPGSKGLSSSESQGNEFALSSVGHDFPARTQPSGLLTEPFTLARSQLTTWTPHNWGYKEKSQGSQSHSAHLCAEGFRHRNNKEKTVVS